MGRKGIETMVGLFVLLPAGVGGWAEHFLGWQNLAHNLLEVSPRQAD